MNRPQLYVYSIIWHPNASQEKEGKKSEIIIQPQTILAKGQEAAMMAATMEVPANLKDELDQIQIAIRPF